MIFWLTSKKKGKELILDVLATDGMLTAKEIYSRLKAKHDYKATYHAVYGLLVALINSKVLLREGNKYCISPAWIDGVYEFLQRINGKKTKMVEIKHAKIFSFETLETADDYLKQFEKKFLSEARGGDKIICWHTTHSWWNIVYSKDQLINLKNLKKKGVKLYTLIEGNTDIDRWIVNIHNKSGMFAKAGVPMKSSILFGVYGPYVLLFVMPKEISDEIKKMYTESSSIENLNINKFFESVFIKKLKNRIKIIIYKNRKEALELSKDIRSHFK